MRNKKAFLFLKILLTLGINTTYSFPYTWSGAAQPFGPADWMTGGNWQMNMAPTDMADFFFFGDATNFNSMNNIMDLTVQSFTFQDSMTQSQDYNLNGMTITLLSGASLSFDNMGFSSSVNYSISSSISSDLTITTQGGGSGILSVGGLFGSGSVSVSGDKLTLLGNNTFTGGLTVAAGNTVLVTANSDALGNGLVTLGSGSKLSFLPNVTFSSSVPFHVTNSIFEPFGTTTLEGIISGNDFTVQQGTLQILNTANDYTGTITVSSGATLAADPEAITGNVDNSGTVRLVVDVGLTKTYSGVISNSGGVTKTGDGAVILDGANTYSGTTVISAGELQATAATLPGDVTIGGSGGLIMNQTAGSATFSHVVQGDGSLRKIGAGTLALTGVNSYGNTVIVEGELQVNTESIPGGANVMSGATLTFDQDSRLGIGTYPYVIIGDGAVTKSGTGTLIFTETNTYTGATTVNGGILAINGSITSDVTVNNTAKLQGSEGVGLAALITGTVTVANGGTLSPGNSIGTMNVSGAVSFGAGSIFEVEVSPTDADLLVVTGTGGVTIDPAAIFSLKPDPGIYTAPLSFLIIDATGSTGGITGSFLNINNTYPLFSPTFVQTADTLRLVLTVESITSLVSTGNAGAVAVCLSAASPASGSDLDTVIGDLVLATSDAELKEALSSMQPSQFTSLFLIQQSLSVQISSKITQKTFDHHARCLTGTRQSGEVWIDFLGDLSEQTKASNDEPGYRAKSGAALIGYDYTSSHNGSLGVCGSYSYTDLKWKEGYGRGQIQSYYGLAYGSYAASHFLLSTSFIGAYNHYQASRHIEIDYIGFDRTASHANQGYELGGNVTIGVPFKQNQLTVMPYFSSDAIYLHQEKFYEYGAQSLDLNVMAANSQYYREEVGLDLQKCLLWPNLNGVAGIQFSYIREIRPQGENLTAQFRELDCHFTVKGFYPSRNLFSPKVSLEIRGLKDQLVLGFVYSGLFGKHFYDQDLNLRIGYSF
jgi:autotransporter-associated beta strand protein